MGYTKVREERELFESRNYLCPPATQSYLKLFEIRNYLCPPATQSYFELFEIRNYLYPPATQPYFKLFEVRNYLYPRATQPFSSFGYTHTHTDRRALLGAVNTTPLKHKREQEIDVEKTISPKNPRHLFPSCHFICLVLK